MRRKHHRNVTRHTHPGSIHPSIFPTRSVRPGNRVRESRPRRATLSNATQARQSVEKPGLALGLGYHFSGILRVGALEKTGFKQQAKSGQTGLALAPQILGSSIIRSQICRACVGHLAAAADLARYRAAESR